MFPSISRATPQTIVETSFTADRNFTLKNNTLGLSIYVNGLIRISGVVGSTAILANDIVKAELTTPTNYLDYKFYFYEIDSIPQSFAVINKSYFAATVKQYHARQRWFLYSEPSHTLSVRYASGVSTNVTFISAQGAISVDDHVVLDPLTSSAYFFNDNGLCINSLLFASIPIDYVKIPTKNIVVILTADGGVYEVNTSGTAQLKRTLTSTENLNQYQSVVNPVITCVYEQNGFLYIGGDGYVWILEIDAGYAITSSFFINQYILNILAVPNSTKCLVVTQNNRLFIVNENGSLTLRYTGVALGQPAYFNSNIYVPDGESQNLLTLDPVTLNFGTPVPTVEFSPKYARVFNGKLYVTGNDNQKVLIYDSTFTLSEITFNDKVTLASAYQNTVLVSHYLKAETTLDARDLYRIIDIKFDAREGPVSHIGTNASEVKTLGNDEVTARTPPGTYLWVNGTRSESITSRGALIYNGDYISLNKEVKVAGAQRTNCIIGDTAYDYDITAYVETVYPRNIEFEVRDPGINFIHERTFTLPARFEACRMSLEYGDLIVNNGLYLGKDLVRAGDVVLIKIVTSKPGAPGNTVLPILTIGSRQFTIPISANPSNIAPQVISLADTQTGVLLTQTIVIGGVPSLYDYYIPSYYDIIIKKNNVVITGNYLQQFGKNDILSVTFRTSVRRYDKVEIYLLGPTNYKLVAENLQPVKVTFMNFGVIQDIYVRDFLPVYNPNDSYDHHLGYDLLTTYVPEYQLITSNIIVDTSSLTQAANLSLEDPFTKFIHNGEEYNSTYLLVNDGDKLALARNVMSYFEANITVYQNVLDPDFDVYVSIPVGTYDIINQTISPPNNIISSTYGLVESDNVAFDSYYDNAASKFRIIKFTENSRKLSSSKEVLHADNFPESVGFSLVNSKTGIIDVAKSQIKKFSSVIRKLSSPRERLQQEDIPEGRRFEFVADKQTEPQSTRALIQVDRISNITNRLVVRKEFLTLTKFPTSIGILDHIVLRRPDHISYDKYRYNPLIDKTETFVEKLSLTKQSSSSASLDTNRLNTAINVFNKASMPNLFFEAIIGEKIQLTEIKKTAPTVILVNEDNLELVKEPNLWNNGTPTSEKINFGHVVKAEPTVKVQPRGDVSKVTIDPIVKPAFGTQVNDNQYIIFNFNTDSKVSLNDINYSANPIKIQVSDISLYKNATFTPETSKENYIKPEQYQQATEKNSYIINVMPDIGALDNSPVAAGSPTIETNKQHYVNRWTSAPDTEEVNYSSTLPLNYTASHDQDTNIRMSAAGTEDSLNYINKNVNYSAQYFNTIEFYASPFRHAEIKHNKVYLNNPKDLDLNYQFLRMTAQVNELSESITPYVNYKHMDSDVGLLNYLDPAEKKYNTLHIKYLDFPEKQIQSIGDRKFVNYESYEKEYTFNNVTYKNFEDSDPRYARSMPNKQENQVGTKLYSDGAEQISENENIVNAVGFTKIELEYNFDKNLVELKEPANFIFKGSVVERSAPLNYTTDPSIVEKTKPINVTSSRTMAEKVEPYRLNLSITQPEIENPDLFNISRTLPEKVKPDLLNVSKTEVELIEPDLINIVPTVVQRVKSDMLNLSVTRVQVEGPDRETLVPLRITVDPTPSTVLYGRNLVEFEREEVWDHDINPPDSLYGAFLTEADAIQAAQIYSQYNPYRILDTEFWTFRVIFDTNLVCTLPRGRYAIAWLIRGG